MSGSQVPSTSHMTNTSVDADLSGVDFAGIRKQLSSITPIKRRRPLTEVDQQGEGDSEQFSVNALWQKLFAGHDIADGDALTMLLDGMSTLRAKLESLHCTSANCAECRKGVEETALSSLQSSSCPLKQHIIDIVVSPMIRNLTVRVDDLDKNCLKEMAFTRRMLNCSKADRAGHSLNEETLCGGLVNLIQSVVCKEIKKGLSEGDRLSLVPVQERAQNLARVESHGVGLTSTPIVPQEWAHIEEEDPQDARQGGGVQDKDDPHTYINAAGKRVRDSATITMVSDVFRNIAKGAVLYLHDPCVPSAEFASEYEKMTAEPRSRTNFARAAVLAYKSEAARRAQSNVADNAGTLVYKNPDGTYQVKIYYESAATSTRPVLVQQQTSNDAQQGVQLDQSFDWSKAPVPLDSRKVPASRGPGMLRSRSVSRSRSARGYYSSRGGQSRGRGSWY